MSYSIEGRVLVLPLGKRVEFQYPIRQAVDLEEIIVVCLHVPANRKLNENVYALNGAGNLLWQVKPVNHIYEKSPYVGLEKAGNLARLFNWDGNVYEVNPKTGDVVRFYWGK